MKHNSLKPPCKVWYIETAYYDLFSSGLNTLTRLNWAQPITPTSSHLIKISNLLIVNPWTVTQGFRIINFNIISKLTIRPKHSYQLNFQPVATHHVVAQKDHPGSSSTKPWLGVLSTVNLRHGGVYWRYGMVPLRLRTPLEDERLVHLQSSPSLRKEDDLNQTSYVPVANLQGCTVDGRNPQQPPGIYKTHRKWWG